MELLRVDSDHPDFLALVICLDKELAISDGDEHDFYSQYNHLTHIKHVVMAYINGKPVGCVAMKELDPKRMEIKRMYTALSSRRKGVATQLLNEIEGWALELNYKSCILETGYKQPDAIALYKNNNYRKISNYDQYVGVENSYCFEKKLTPHL